MKFKENKNLILQYLRQRKKETFLIVFLGVVSNILTILIPVSIGKYYELVFHLHPRRVKFLRIIPNEIWNTVPKFLLFFVALLLLRYVFFFLYEFSLRKEAAIFIKEIKDYLFAHQLNIKYQIYKDKGVGKYLLRYSGDINSLKNLYIKGTIRIFIDIIMVFIALSWLYKLNRQGTIAIVLLSLFFYFILRLINKKVEYYSLLKRNSTSGQLSFVSRTLQSIINTITLNKQNIELKKYKKKSNNIKKVSIKYNKWFVLNKGFISFIQYFILAVVLYVFYNDAQKSKSLGSDLISFILLYITILPVIRRLFLIETIYKLGNISLRKLKDILALQEEDFYKGKQLKVNNPTIEFIKVSFCNSDLINFIAKKSKINKLRLPKGVDFLEIVFAMIRIQENYQGEIKINKVNIKEFSPISVRENIAIASIQIPISGRSVYEAITQYRSKRIKNKVYKKFEHIKQFFNIDLNIDDDIGENGLKLSELQKEFLVLVRGLIQEKRILIVDQFYLLESINNESLFHLLQEQKQTVIKISN